MRLIDADNIEGYAKYIKTNENFEPYIMLEDLVKLLDNQPTAFDIDKVVDELETNKQNALEVEESIKEYNVWNKAIEIVNAGGENE